MRFYVFWGSLSTPHFSKSLHAFQVLGRSLQTGTKEPSATVHPHPSGEYYPGGLFCCVFGEVCVFDLGMESS